MGRGIEPTIESLLIRLDGIIPFENKVAQERCPNTKRKGLKVCDICEESCQAGAVRVDGQVIIDLDRCVECGICSAQCPNEVFLLPSVSDHSLLQEIVRSLRITNAVHIECNGVNGLYLSGKEGHPHEGSIVVPCLASVPETPILLGYLRGASEFSFGDCPEECENHRGAEAYRRTTEILRLLRGTLSVEGEGEGEDREEDQGEDGDGEEGEDGDGDGEEEEGEDGEEEEGEEKKK